ncbi:MAG: hypothetical protein CMF31_05790 [Kordiimonas sp.]|nr:hypothetical protein [Kordiimonas sp.]|tara:strand:- start:697 stop:1185 length:489 start_codon:yes stop_codon:yes gene_type:complete
MSAAQNKRICEIELDEKSIISRSAEVEHERRVAIFDLLEENHFDPQTKYEGDYDGPYKVVLSLIEDRLSMEIFSDQDQLLETIILPLKSFRRVIKEYFMICESYFNAIKKASPSQIEAIDMGRRGLHNEGSEILRERLEDKIALDLNTARRLFTLICVLQIR